MKRIAVISNKGGCGKSCVTVALARALHAAGHKVGVCDMDVSGPNDHYLLNAEDLFPDTSDDMVVAPTTSEGIRLMTVGFYLKDKHSLLWEEERKEGIPQQFLKYVDWGDTEYLILDLPPGTEGVTKRIISHLQERHDVFLLVTTPRVEAVRDAQRTVHALNYLGGKIAGCVMNMSFFCCPDCETKHPNGDRGLVEELGIPVLAEIPMLLHGEELEDHIDVERVLRGIKPKLFRRH